MAGEGGDVSIAVPALGPLATSGGKSRTALPREEMAELSWQGLTVKVVDYKKNEKTILKGVNGYLKPGQMLAIMGPSGCGKSTLLEAIAGRSSASITGDISINGHKSHLGFGLAAYVTQDDLLVEVLTVKETLEYAALLRLPQSMSLAEKRGVANEVMTQLGLSDAADTPVGNWYLRGVSGGQRRRLTLGCELVTGPNLIFLDEPTSGLDAAAAYYVMEHVRHLAKQGRTIMCVIHQPSGEVYSLFDRLCLLSDGNVVFFGPADRSADFFAAAGFPAPAGRSQAEHLLHTINRDFSGSEDVDAKINTLVAAYEKSDMNAEVLESVKQLKASPGPVYKANTDHPGWLYQTQVLTKRSVLNNLRNVGVFWVRLVMYVMLCIVIGFIYFQLDLSWPAVYSRTALLFFVVAFLTFMSIAAFPAFIEDMKVFIRERLNGYYGVSQFVVANSVASLPFIFLIAVLCSVPLYFLAGLDHSGDRFIYFILNLFLSLTVVEGLMMAIAPLVPHYLMGIAAGAGLLGFFMLCCGYFQPLGQLPKPVFTYPVYWIAYHSYALDGLMNNEFRGRSGFGCPCSIQPGGCPNPNCTITGAQALETWQIHDRNKWWDILILACMTILYRFFFFLAIKLKEKWAKKKY